MECYGVVFHMVLQYLFFNISLSEIGKCLLLTLATFGKKERHYQCEDGIHTTEKLTRIWIRQKECFHLT